MENLVAEAEMKNLVAMADRARAKPNHPDKSKMRCREIMDEITSLTAELKANRLSRAAAGKQVITILYEPIGVTVAVRGEEIRKKRNKAGLINQSEFAAACGWSQSRQNQFEANGRHEMALETIKKMIRVCNGGG